MELYKTLWGERRRETARRRRTLMLTAMSGTLISSALVMMVCLDGIGSYRLFYVDDATKLERGYRLDTDELSERMKEFDRVRAQPLEKSAADAQLQRKEAQDAASVATDPSSAGS